MFGHDRLEVFRNVFDITLGASPRAAVQRTAAIGTTVGLWMFFVGVDMLGQWLWTACSHMPWFTARLLLSLARGVLGLRCVGFIPEGAACELLSEAGLP